MAPVRPVLNDNSIPSLYTSSLELDLRDAIPTPTVNVLKRDTLAYKPGAGTTSPESFNNAGMLALFALLGTGMVVASIWFFFWAKNGGFKFQQGDWDDYKSTVLRRKGPDGKTLSNATKSTKLGGGTIAGSQHYAWQKHVARSVVGRDEKGRKGVLAKRGWAKTHSILYSDDYLTDSLATRTVTDEMTELRSEPDLEHGRDNHHHSKRYRDRDVTAYKKEKPARVGGLNRIADGSSHFDTNTERSELLTDNMTETSEQPILPKPSKKTNKESERESAERKAREEAKRMERRWKQEAEEAAAALARENHRAPSVAAPTPPKKSHAPASRPSAQKQRHRSEARSASPRKRDFSYQTGTAASEVLSTAYTGSTSNRTASYYDEYRPRATENPRYSSEYAGGNRSRQSSPKKKSTGAGRSAGGYRRGGHDSDLE